MHNAAFLRREKANLTVEDNVVVLTLTNVQLQDEKTETDAAFFIASLVLAEYTRYKLL